MPRFPRVEYENGSDGRGKEINGDPLGRVEVAWAPWQSVFGTVAGSATGLPDALGLSCSGRCEPSGSGVVDRALS